MNKILFISIIFLSLFQGCNSSKENTQEVDTEKVLSSGESIECSNQQTFSIKPISQNPKVTIVSHIIKHTTTITLSIENGTKVSVKNCQEVF